MSGHSCSCSDPRRQLPTALQLHILSLLPYNERALTGRLAFRDAADAFHSADDCTASLEQPLPPQAVSWALEAGRQHVRALPFWQKFQLLSNAARSGSVVNLEVALTLLQPSVFPELLQSVGCSYNRCISDPGMAAVQAGHVHLLGWVLSHCPGLTLSHSPLMAAAQHCSLAGLQEVWETLQAHSSTSSSTSSSPQPLLGQYILGTVAQSTTPDTIAKMQWVLDTAGEACCLESMTDEVALLADGKPGLLRWLRDQGCYPRSAGNCYSDAFTLGRVALPFARWLVDEAGFHLPQPGNWSGHAGRSWTTLLQAAVQSGDGVAKLHWLQERGAPPLVGEGSTQLLPGLVEWAAAAGQLETLRYLVPLLAQGGQAPAGLYADRAVASGSTAVADYLRHAGLAFTVRAYDQAAVLGRLEMVRWLAQEAGVSAEGLNLANFVEFWPKNTAKDSRDLLQAVQMVVGVAGCRGWAARGVLSCAAARGDLALVQYLQGQQGQQGQQQGRRRQRGRWLDGKALAVAAMAGCEALLEWLVQQNPCSPVGRGGNVSPYVHAAENGDRATLAALRRLGVPWGTEDVVLQAMKKRCQLPVLRWLVEQGAPAGRAKDVEEEVARWLRREDLDAEAVVLLRGLMGPAAAAAAAAAAAEAEE